MGKISKQDELFLQELGKAISAFRKKKGLTQVELGFRCDIEKPNMRRLEAGKTNPTILTLRKICNGLEINLKDLIDDLQ